MDLDLRNLPLLVLAYPKTKELLLEMIERLRAYSGELERRKEKLVMGGARFWPPARKSSSIPKVNPSLPPDLARVNGVGELFERGRRRFKEIEDLRLELESTVEKMLALESEIGTILLKAGVFRPEPSSTSFSNPSRVRRSKTAGGFPFPTCPINPSTCSTS
jgi:hypothetical protein